MFWASSPVLTFAYDHHRERNVLSHASGIKATKRHQGFLTQCLPVELQPLFKCRLQGIVQTNSQLKELQQACLQRLSKTIPHVPLKESPFVSNTTTISVLAPGSFVISMPTIDNRSALVVFPPGNQSLEDIKHMLRKDSLEGVTRLQQVRLSDGGDHPANFIQSTTRMVANG